MVTCYHTKHTPHRNFVGILRANVIARWELKRHLDGAYQWINADSIAEHLFFLSWQHVRLRHTLTDWRKWKREKATRFANAFLCEYIISFQRPQLFMHFCAPTVILPSLKHNDEHVCFSRAGLCSIHTTREALLILKSAICYFPPILPWLDPFA